MNMRIKSKPIVMIHHVPIITLFSTTLKVPPAHLFESDDPEPNESGLKEFDSLKKAKKKKFSDIRI